jgi:hypothetical protein
MMGAPAAIGLQSLAENSPEFRAAVIVVGNAMPPEKPLNLLYIKGNPLTADNPDDSLLKRGALFLLRNVSGETMTNKLWNGTVAEAEQLMVTGIRLMDGNYSQAGLGALSYQLGVGSTVPGSLVGPVLEGLQKLGVVDLTGNLDLQRGVATQERDNMFLDAMLAIHFFGAPAKARVMPQIEGQLDTPRTLQHMATQDAIAHIFQESGNYERVAMAEPLSKFSGVKHVPDIKADVMGLRPGGRIDLVEVLSPKQKYIDLWNKLVKARNQLPPKMRGSIRVVKPPEE